MNNKDPSSSKRPIMVIQGAKPPSRLIASNIQLEQMTAHMNQRYLSGLQLENMEWQNLHETVTEMHHLLDRVEYHHQS
jgi:hypothetical protein